MTGVSGGPKAEAVVVLAGEDHALHACAFGCRYPLVGIQLGRVKKLGIFGSVAPFSVCICIHSEMKKCIEFRFLIGKLPVTWNNSN